MGVWDGGEFVRVVNACMRTIAKLKSRFLKEISSLIIIIILCPDLFLKSRV